ncbi:head GIN domain-containing protein [Chitinimonas koreensis]|uniref:head GIN domain-containing protein n=1 Tax=Chitinimonas koreensis TaxID=356302 RepID=UPI00040CDD9D|nr:head GIN domain-containing protein [Chitinimonas koreensis]QNM95116.1 DUF2807 domain-containing protein [Chitinimonas koreensis]
MRTSLLLVLCLPLAACSIDVDHDEKSGDVKKVHVSIGSVGGVHGNGTIKSETRTVAAVKKVQATGSVDVDIRIGSTPSLTVEADENLLSMIHTEQTGDTLTIRTEGSFSTNHPFKVTLVTPSVEALTHTGSGDVDLAGLAGGDLAVESTGSGDTRLGGKVGKLTLRLVGSGDLSGDGLMPSQAKVELMGSGDVDLGRIEVERFEVAVNGSGRVSANGTARTLSGKVMGSGDLELGQLQAEDAELELVGSGNIEAYAKQSVKARASGSGDLTVHGSPAKQELSGKNLSVEE